MARLTKLDSVLSSFDDQLRYAKRRPHEIVSCEALRATRFGKDAAWADCAGAYVMVDGDTPKYIGRALKGSGLRARLMEHSRGNDRLIRGLLERAGTSVIVIPLENDDAWLAPSLELFLHWKLRDDGVLWNKKRS